MNVLVLGGNSDMGMAIARQFALKEKARIFLASRDIELLKKNLADLDIRSGIEAQGSYFDAEDFDSHKDFVNSFPEDMDVVIIAFGVLFSNEKCIAEPDAVVKMAGINFTGSINVCSLIAEKMKRRGKGCIIGISSVAGDRGRPANYFYGCTKAGFSAFLSGLRATLHGSGVSVMTVLPGFIRTKMTHGMQVPPLLEGNVEQVGESVYRAWKHNKMVVYTPWYWYWIMMVIRSIPERIFARLSL
jgi:short-subunit dehydrogenase